MIVDIEEICHNIIDIIVNLYLYLSVARPSPYQISAGDTFFLGCEWYWRPRRTAWVLFFKNSSEQVSNMFIYYFYQNLNKNKFYFHNYLLSTHDKECYFVL